MPDYKTMYFQLAAKVADAIELLTSAQLDGEEAYLLEQAKQAELNADETSDNGS